MSDIEQELRDARYLIGMLIAQCGGRIEVTRKTMIDFDPTQSVAHWDDSYSGSRFYVLQKVTATHPQTTGGKDG